MISWVCTKRKHLGNQKRKKKKKKINSSKSLWIFFLQKAVSANLKLQFLSLMKDTQHLVHSKGHGTCCCLENRLHFEVDFRSSSEYRFQYITIAIWMKIHMRTYSKNMGNTKSVSIFLLSEDFFWYLFLLPCVSFSLFSFFTL